MAETLDRIYRLTVDGTQAARQLGEIERATTSLDNKLAGAINGMKAFAVSMAGVASVGAVVGSIKRNIDAMDELAKAVQKVGIGAEDLQKLRYAADLSGVAAETLDKSIGKLAVSMTDLQTGATDAHRALRAIGVQSGDSPTQALNKIADAFQKMPDGIDKTALAIKLFGKAGADLIPLLNGGAEGLKKLGDEAERYGGVLTGGTLSAAEAFNDNLSRLEKVTAGVSGQITAGMLPALQAITQSLVDSATSGGGFIDVGREIGKMLINVSKAAILTVAELKSWGMQAAALKLAWDSPTKAPSIFTQLGDDMRALSAEADQKAAKLQKMFEDFSKAAAGGGQTPKPSGKDPQLAALEARLTAAKEADARAEAQRKKQKEDGDELARQDRIQTAAARALVQIRKDEEKVLDDLAQQQERNRKATEDATKAQKAFIDSLDPSGATLDAYFENLAKLEELYANGTIGVEQYNRAQVTLNERLGKSGDAAKKQKTELDILSDGFEGFFTSLSSGAANAEDAFKRMAQSIIAELLKIWAQKYIINMLFPGSGGTAPTGGGGITAPRFAMPSFAVPSSSAIVGPSPFATSAGAAISPLRFGGSGNLSLPAQQQQAMQVTINNNAAGVQVETRQTPGGLEVNIDQIRAALSADILRGGNVMSHAAERAWGLSRGSAAAF